MYLEYTHQEDELYTQSLRNINDRHQAYYDYHGELNRDEDYADCYTAVKAVAIA